MENRNIDINAVNNFWSWFKSISDDLLLAPTNSGLIAQIDTQVNQLGVFDWEIGPWQSETYYFSISPNLNIDSLPYTKQIIALAPECNGWHFFPSKPPKVDWMGIWEMENETGKGIHVDSNNWRYVLYQFEDQTFDMDIIVDNIDGNTNTINLAVDIALTGYLGEELFITLINHIRVVTGFGDDVQNKTTSIKYIKSHIDSLGKPNLII